MTGKANNHAAANDVTTGTVTFLSAAFVGSPTLTSTTITKNDINILFDKPSVSPEYTTMDEAKANHQ